MRLGRNGRGIWLPPKPGRIWAVGVMAYSVRGYGVEFAGLHANHPDGPAAASAACPVANQVEQFGNITAEFTCC